MRFSVPTANLSINFIKFTLDRSHDLSHEKKITVLSGAGISAESGIPTFRDSDGLWEGFDVMEVATPEGWNRNPGLVFEFIINEENVHWKLSQTEVTKFWLSWKNYLM